MTRCCISSFDMFWCHCTMSRFISKVLKRHAKRSAQDDLLTRNDTCCQVEHGPLQECSTATNSLATCLFDPHLCHRILWNTISIYILYAFRYIQITSSEASILSSVVFCNNCSFQLWIPGFEHGHFECLRSTALSKLVFQGLVSDSVVDSALKDGGW